MDPVCFIIQPFDGGVYDGRFREIYKPAVERAGFIPYRVDEDASASIPVEQIEKGIRDAAVCFAEITEDNPNVWFELGLAIANGKDVCLVCSHARTRFPFDVQHRQIIRYQNGTPSDFEKLGSRISDRLDRLKQKQGHIASLPRAVVNYRSDENSLADYEIACLGVLASNSVGDDDPMPVYTLQRALSNSGYTDIAANTAVRMLMRKSFVSLSRISEFNSNETFTAVTLTSDGWAWVETNLNSFVLKHGNGNKNESIGRMSEAIDDDIPF